MGCRAVRRLMRMLGRRGAILLSYGAVWSLYGYGVLVSPLPSQPGLALAIDLLPLRVWGWLWIGAGLIALVSAWLPQGVDWLGFLTLPLIVLPWMLSYLTAWLQGVFPRGWIAAAVWAAIAVPVLVTAGWSEPPRVKRVSNG